MDSTEISVDLDLDVILPSGMGVDHDRPSQKFLPEIDIGIQPIELSPVSSGVGYR